MVETQDLASLKARHSRSDYLAAFSNRLSMRMSFLGLFAGKRGKGSAWGQAVGPERPDESGQRLGGPTDMLTAGDVSNAFTRDLSTSYGTQRIQREWEKKEGLYLIAENCITLRLIGKLP